MRFDRRKFLRAVLAASPAVALSGLAGCAALPDTNNKMPGKGANKGVTKGYLDGPFGQIHYYEAGRGPALIMSHQSPTSARMFERAMRPLSDFGLRVIAVDTPGFGNSDTPDQPPSISDYADAFMSVLTGLGLSEAHFLGHHTGAAIVCNLAARYPEVVTSLVLNGPPLLTAEDLEKFADVELAPKPINKDGSHLIAAWRRRAGFTAGWTDEIAMHRRLVDNLWAGDTAWYGHNAAFKYDMGPDATAITNRTLILTNTGDDLYESALRLKLLRPDFDYVELAGGTHDIVDEQPLEWAKAVANFVLQDALQK